MQSGVLLTESIFIATTCQRYATFADSGEGAVHDVTFPFKSHYSIVLFVGRLLSSIAYSPNVLLSVSTSASSVTGHFTEYLFHLSAAGGHSRAQATRSASRETLHGSQVRPYRPMGHLHLANILFFLNFSRVIIAE